jgi:hypothetical protein
MRNAPKDHRVTGNAAHPERPPLEMKELLSQTNRTTTHLTERLLPGKEAEKETRKEDPSSKHIPKKKKPLHSLRFRSLNRPEITPAKGKIAVHRDQEKTPAKKQTRPPDSFHG